MAMQAGPLKVGEPTSEINTTPLIDVMLVLLIMLIVTLPPPQHAVKINTAQQSGLPPVVEPPRPVHIKVDFDGSYRWNGVALDAASLDRMLRGEARRQPHPEIHIEPHRLAKYGYVAHVMAVAQREGLTRLGVVGGT